MGFTAEYNPFEGHVVDSIAPRGRIVTSMRAFGAVFSVPLSNSDLHVVGNVVPKQIDVPDMPIVSMQQFTCDHVGFINPEQPLWAQFPSNQPPFAFDKGRLHSAQVISALVRFACVSRPRDGMG